MLVGRLPCLRDANLERRSFCACASDNNNAQHQDAYEGWLRGPRKVHGTLAGDRKRRHCNRSNRPRHAGASPII